MLLDPLFEVLLGTANVLLVGDLTIGLVYHYGVAAFVVVFADSTSTVAIEIGEVKGDDIARDFAVKIALEKFSKVKKAAVGHRNAEPREGREPLFHVSDGLTNRGLPVVGEAYFEVGSSLPVSFVSFLDGVFYCVFCGVGNLSEFLC